MRGSERKGLKDVKEELNEAGGDGNAREGLKEVRGDGNVRDRRKRGGKENRVITDNLSCSSPNINLVFPEFQT